MSVIKFTNFGGEIPRVPPRALPPEAAQINKNLLVTATEFRPLLDDTVVAVGVAGAKTLYRLSRESEGVLRSDPALGWMATADDICYVKGQVYDDAKERTYLTDNDGLTKPQATDVTAALRVLGVPPPTSIITTLAAVSHFTQDDANTWKTGTLIPAVVTAIKDAIGSYSASWRYSDEVPLAGPFGFYGLSAGTLAWNLDRLVPVSDAATLGLKDPQLGGLQSGVNWLISITALPFWGEVQTAPSLSAALAAIENPKTTSDKLWSPTQAGSLATTISDYFDPSKDFLKTQRTALDEAVQKFQTAINFLLTAAPTKPTAPTKPPPPEYETTTLGDAGETTTRVQAWTTYDGLLADYNDAMEAYNAAKSERDNERASRISEIVQLQAQALKLTKEIEALFTARMDGLDTWVGTILDNMGIAKTDTNQNGLVAIDPDRIMETRFYIATCVSDWNEESAPSPISAMLELDQNDKVMVDVTIPYGRKITKWRLYRTNAGNQTSGFQFVAEIKPAGIIDATTTISSSYLDAVKGAKLGEICPTITWAEPPFRRDWESTTDTTQVIGGDPFLRGLIGMPNGVMAGFIDNFVAFCEPYHPYAWPVEYQIPVEFPITGLGVFGQTLFVGTLANPYLISGSDSASMSAIKLDEAQACVSRRSIVSMNGGVIYASPDGLCFASQAGVQVLTGALFSREDWQALTPKSIFAVSHEGVYYFWFSGAYGGTPGGCLALDMVAKKLTRMDMPATAVFADALTNAVFFCDGSDIKQAFSHTERRIGTWKSGKIVLPKHEAMVWLQVDADFGTVIVRWYGDGNLIKATTVTSTTPVRLPPGRYLEHEIEIESAERITKVMLASTTAALQAA